MKRFAALMLALLLILPCAARAADEEESMPWEGPGFGTPEEAVIAYLAGLRDGDLYAMLRAFAIRPMAEHATLERYLSTVGAYQTESWPSFPDDAGFLRALNETSFVLDLLTSFQRALYLYVMGSEDPMDAVKTLAVKEEADADAVVNAFDAARMEELRSLGNVRILPAELIDPARYDTDRMRRQAETYLARYGADELCDRVAVFTSGGKVYGIAPRLARYGDAWYVASLYNPITSMVGAEAPFCALWPLSEKAEALLAYLPEGTGAAELPEARSGSPAFAVPWENAGFDTPEEAVRAYLDGLADGDLNAMLGAFAWGPMAERTTLKNMMMFLKTYAPNGWPVFPDDGGLLRQTDALLLLRRWLAPIRFSIREYLIGDALRQDPFWMSAQTVRIREEFELQAFLALFDLARIEALRGMEIVLIGTPDAAVGTTSAYYGDGIQSTLEKYRTAYGADELGDMAAVFIVGGKRYGFFPQVVRYGDRWYLGAESGVLSAVLGITNTAAIAPLE